MAHPARAVAVSEKPAAEAQGTAATASVPWRFRFRWAVLPLLFIVIVTGAFLRPGMPAFATIEGPLLVARDSRNRSLWQHSFTGLEEGWYQTRSDSRWKPAAQVAGGKVIFAHRWVAAEGHLSELIAYDRDGQLSWRHQPGGAVRTTDRSFDRQFNIDEFLIRDGRIFVTSHHHRYWPSYFQILTLDGALVGDYWHAGALPHVQATKDRIFLGGVNNAHRPGTLVVLDPERMGGASSGPPPYQLLDLPKAQEAARILFPRSCINKATAPYGRVTSITEEEEGILVTVQQHNDLTRRGEILYHLTQDLAVRSMVVGEDYLLWHQQLHRDGTLDHAYGPGEAAELRKLRKLE